MKKFCGHWGKRAVYLTAAVLLTAALGGCGAKSSDYVVSDTAAALAPDDAGVYENSYASADIAGEEMSEQGQDSSGQTPQAQEKASGRKLITEVSMDVETEHYDQLIADVEERVKALGGYIESSYTTGKEYGYAADASSATRYGEIRARIPQQRLDEFITAVEGASNVISRRENVQDVTLEYVDLESHRTALKVEQERLLELLEKAETVEDIITIESRLSDVRYQLESMESQLRTFDNKIDYSTVSLNISEVIRLTPASTGETSVWERIGTGFSENLYRLGHGLSEFFIGMAIRLPFILAWTVFFLVVALGAFVIVKAVRRREAKQAAKADARRTADGVQQAARRETVAGPQTPENTPDREKTDADGKKSI